MTPYVVGMEADEAQRLLAGCGFDVKRVEYVSRRSVENADSARVIRMKDMGNNSIEITVSWFRTRI